MTETPKPTTRAALVVALFALASAGGAYVSGWGLLVRAFLPATGGATEAGAWMLGGSFLALVFDGLAIVLGGVAILLRIGKRSPFALPIAIFAIVLGLVGLVGVAILGFGGLLFVAPVH